MPLRAQSRLDREAEAYLGDHVVQGVVVVPGAALLDVVIAAAGAVARGAGPSSVVEGVEFRRALVLPDEPGSMEFRLDVSGDEGYFEIRSRRAGGSDAWTEHTRGRINVVDGHRPPPSLDLTAIRSRLANEVPVSLLYQKVAEVGLQLGPSFRGVTRFWPDGAGREALSLISVPPAVAADVSRFLFHPAVLDSAVQTAGYGCLCTLHPGGIAVEHRLLLPVRVGRAELYERLGTNSLWCYSICEWKTDEEAQCSLQVWDESGRPLAFLEHLVLRHVPGSEGPGASPLYQEEWQARPAPGPEHRHRFRGTWVVLASRADCPVSWAALTAIRADGARAAVCHPGPRFRSFPEDVYELRPDQAADYLALLRQLGRGERVEGVLHLWALSGQFGPQGIRDGVVNGPSALTYLVQALDSESRWGAARPRVWLVTRGAESVGSGDQDRRTVAPSFLAGFTRVVRSERADLSVCVIDLDRAPTEGEARAVVREMRQGLTDIEIAFRGEARYVRTVQPLTAPAGRARRQADVARDWFAATLPTPGVLDSITWQERPERAPGPDEVEIAVRAVGLNFKDVALALGLLRGEAFATGHTGAELGMECSGVVTRVGPNVTSVRVGDEVLGIGPRALTRIAHRRS
jgi:acyl transferase domain-containing protein